MNCTQDDYGTSYYYRGAVENNYVSFAGMCWRIVRVDGNNNTKLVLYNANGPDCMSEGNTNAFAVISGTNTKTEYNSSQSTRYYNAGIGYMYGDANASSYELVHSNDSSSTIKEKLDTWYTSVFNNNQRGVLADVVWCNDKSLYSGNGIYNAATQYGGYGRLNTATNANPTLKCPDINYSPLINSNLSRMSVSYTIGNGKLTSKIGLLTADEVAFAGGVVGTNNSNYYLVKNTGNSYWWTMTPASYSSGNYGNVYAASQVLSLSSVTNYYNMRPSISINANAVASDGEGTADNPYIITGINDNVEPVVSITPMQDAATGGLNYTFKVEQKGSSDVTIYYCKDLDNTCNPNIKIGENVLLTSFNLVDGEYYIRAKGINESGISSEIVTYHANISEEIIGVNTLLAKIKPSTCKNPTTIPGRTTATTDEGMNCTQDDYGNSYYYRGAVENNYVSFANMCWRIVRIDGNNNIKLVLYNYSGPDCLSTGNTNAFAVISGTNTKTAYNTSQNTRYYNAGVGYMFGDANGQTYNDVHANNNSSTIKENLDAWYNNKLTEYSENLADVVWCNDKSLYSGTGAYNVATQYGGFGRLNDKSKASPSLKCQDIRKTLAVDIDISRMTTSNLMGNGKLTSKVGLLTADEVAFAGGAFGTNNSNYYLVKNTGNSIWWTMTPTNYSSGNYGNVYTAGQALSSQSVTSSYNLRPAISLKANTLVFSDGNGTAENPYKIVNKDSLAYAVLSNNSVTSPVTTPGREVSTASEKVLASSPDDYGTSYYFRGNIDNNYVVFANKCWKIVRITGDKSVKLVLQNNNGTSCESYNPAGTSAYNDPSNSNAYIGFMYGNVSTSANYNTTHVNNTDSIILKSLKTWYDSSFNSAQKALLADVIWCNEKRLSADNSNTSSYGKGTAETKYLTMDRVWPAETANPSLMCGTSRTDNLISKFTASDTIYGNGKLKGTNGSGTDEYKIGLLTVDEVAFAGGAYEMRTDYSYLYAPNSFWTMSPSAYSFGSARLYLSVQGNLNNAGSNAKFEYDLRPSIALKSTVSYTLNGTGVPGSVSNPYIIPS